MSKIFYKMRLVPSEQGLSIWTDRFYSVHETPCYHFCIAEWQRGFDVPALIKDGETAYQSLKRRGVKLRKVAKQNSRVAFEDREQAFKNLIYLKGRQLMHMKRDLEFLNAFLSFTKDNTLDDLQDVHSQLIVPKTKDLVLGHYVFD